MEDFARLFADPGLFGELISFFVAPLGILLLSWLVQRHFEARLNAGVEFFAFLAALDFAYFAQSAQGGVRVNPRFVDHYYPLFVSLVIMSLLLLAYAARTQGQIFQHLAVHSPSGNVGGVSGEESMKLYYPVAGVVICWTVALAAIGFHLYVVLG